MSRIDKIQNYRYPVSQPTVFDEEELTVLSLVSKNVHKTNEIIDLINGNVSDAFMEVIKNIMTEGLFKFALDPETESLVLQIEFSSEVGGDCSCNVGSSYIEELETLVVRLG